MVTLKSSTGCDTFKRAIDALKKEIKRLAALVRTLTARLKELKSAPKPNLKEINRTEQAIAAAKEQLAVARFDLSVLEDVFSENCRP